MDNENLQKNRNERKTQELIDIGSVNPDTKKTAKIMKYEFMGPILK